MALSVPRAYNPSFISGLASIPAVKKCIILKSYKELKIRLGGPQSVITHK
jgi:hypothetical protein